MSEKKTFHRSQEEKSQMMTTKEVEKLIPKMAIPSMISMLISCFYNLADTFFVGKLGNEPAAAIGVVFSYMNFVQAIGYFYGQGSGTYMSRMLGRQENEKAGRMMSCGFWYALITAILCMLTGLIFARPLAIVLGSIDSVLPYAVQYLRIISLGAPFTIMTCVLNGQLRFQGNAMFSMIAIVAGAVLNALLDPVLIFVFGWGLNGAAIATVLAQLISFIILLTGAIKMGNLQKSSHWLTWEGWAIKEITKGGFPTLIRQGLSSVATILLNHVAGGFGVTTMVGMSIMQRVMTFANAMLVGFGQGFQTVCGMNYGAKLYERVKRSFRFSLKWSTLYLLVLSSILWIFAETISSWFRDDLEVIAISSEAIRFVCYAFPFNGFIILGNMMLQVCGKSVQATILSMARQGFFFIPLIFLLPGFCGIKGLEMTQMVSDFLTFLLSFPFVIKFIRSF